MPESDPRSKLFLIDPVLPTQAVHLIAGPSGAGKTTFLLQVIRDWLASIPVMGMPVYPTSLHYIALDRTYLEVCRRMHAVGLPENAFPWDCLGHLRSPNFLRVIDHPGVTNADVIIIEGVARLIPGGRINDYSTVADFLTDLSNYCTARKKTIIATTHANKLRGNELHIRRRDRVMGSNAWSAYSSTVIIIDSVDMFESEDDRRMIRVEPRDSKPFSYNAIFNSYGQLETIEDSLSASEARVLQLLEPNEQVTADDLRKKAAFVDLGRSVLFANAQRLVDKHYFDKPIYGSYRRIR